MAISKLLLGMCAAAFALAASSCCNMVNNDCGKNCDVWPVVQDHAEYGNACRD